MVAATLCSARLVYDLAFVAWISIDMNCSSYGCNHKSSLTYPWSGSIHINLEEFYNVINLEGFLRLTSPFFSCIFYEPYLSQPFALKSFSVFLWVRLKGASAFIYFE